MNYISTREGVEKIDNTCGLLPVTVKQKELIADILSKIEDADRMHEYYDYLQRPTRENATEFITQALENNLDIIAKKKNYIDYLANRPRVEKIGTHGLFSNEGGVCCAVPCGRGGGKSSGSDMDKCYQLAERGCRKAWV
ncbi:MAG: hypothetical protein ACLR1H_15620 [Roseburia intestinalis]